MQSETLSKVMSDIQLDDDGRENIAVTYASNTILRDARLKKNLTLQEASNQLRLSVKQIEALEDSRFDTLPEPVIVRGFIRNYTKLLGVDAAPVLNHYKKLVPEEVLSPYLVESSINRAISTKDKQFWPKYVVASGLLLLCVVAWLLYTNFTEKHVKLGGLVSNVGLESSQPAPVLAPEPLPEIALPAAERVAVAGDLGAAESASVADSQAAGVAAELKLPAVPSESAVVVATKPAINPIAAPVANVTTSTVPSATLSFGTKEESWVNVVDVNGHVIYSKVLAAGTQDSAQVDKAALPVKVIVGNINGTSFSYNGNAVDLTVNAKHNVAKFILK